MESNKKKPTNEEVLFKCKESEDVAVTFLFQSYSDLVPKPSSYNLKKCVQRLKEKHKKLNKRRTDEIKSGISGQEGTYDHWAKQVFSMPAPAVIDPEYPKTPVPTVYTHNSTNTV